MQGLSDSRTQLFNYNDTQKYKSKLDNDVDRDTDTSTTG